MIKNKKTPKRKQLKEDEREMEIRVIGKSHPMISNLKKNVPRKIVESCTMIDGELCTTYTSKGNGKQMCIVRPGGPSTLPKEDTKKSI